MLFLSYPNKKTFQSSPPWKAFNAQIIPYSGQLHSPLYNDNHANQADSGIPGQYPPAISHRIDLNVVSSLTHKLNRRIIN